MTIRMTFIINHWQPGKYVVLCGTRGPPHRPYPFLVFKTLAQAENYIQSRVRMDSHPRKLIVI
jgi:hypothetical protein